MEKTDPFAELSPQDQEIAIDAVLGVVLIDARLPESGKALYDYVTDRFAAARSLPLNLARYALKSLGKKIYTHDWTMVIEKNGQTVVTQFIPAQPLIDPPTDDSD